MQKEIRIKSSHLKHMSTVRSAAELGLCMFPKDLKEKTNIMNE